MAWYLSCRPVVPPSSVNFDSSCQLCNRHNKPQCTGPARDTVLKPDTVNEGGQLCEESRSTNIPQHTKGSLGFMFFSSSKVGPLRRVPRSSQSKRYQDDFRTPNPLELELDWLEHSGITRMLM